MLVDGVVGQVHEDIVHVSPGRFFVRLCAESGEGHLMQEYAQRVHSIQKYINSQIVLEIINQVRSINVLLHDVTHTLRVNVVLIKKLIMFSALKNLID